MVRRSRAVRVRPGQKEKHNKTWVYCTISINSARTVRCDRLCVRDGFVNTVKPRDTERKIDKNCSKLPFWDEKPPGGFDIPRCVVLQLWHFVDFGGPVTHERRIDRNSTVPLHEHTRVRHRSNRGYNFENHTHTRWTRTCKTTGFYARGSVNQFMKVTNKYSKT